jgi:hypothetical protein
MKTGRTPEINVCSRLCFGILTITTVAKLLRWLGRYQIQNCQVSYRGIHNCHVSAEGIHELRH